MFSLVERIAPDNILRGNFSRKVFNLICSTSKPASSMLEIQNSCLSRIMKLFERFCNVFELTDCPPLLSLHILFDSAELAGFKCAVA